MALFVVPWRIAMQCHFLFAHSSASGCKVQRRFTWPVDWTWLNMIEDRFVCLPNQVMGNPWFPSTMDIVDTDPTVHPRGQRHINIWSRTCQRWPLPLTSRLPETPWLCVSFASCPPWFVQVPTQGPGPRKFWNIVDKWLYCCYLGVIAQNCPMILIDIYLNRNMLTSNSWWIPQLQMAIVLPKTHASMEDLATTRLTCLESFLHPNLIILN